MFILLVFPMSVYVCPTAFSKTKVVLSLMTVKIFSLRNRPKTLQRNTAYKCIYFIYIFFSKEKSKL